VNDRVELGIESLDSLDGTIDQFHRRNLSAAHQFGLAGSVHKC
jgi:hypothetical protein